MILSLSTDNGLQIEEPLNFKAFSFHAKPDQKFSDTDAVTFVGEFAWVAESALRNWPELAGNPQWQSGLDAMVGYAASKGWVDPVSGRIRAHIERI
jgi:hypothetical protein